MRWINNTKVCPVVIILICLAGLNAVAQDNQAWDKSVLKDSIVTLFSKYQSLHNNLNSQTDPAVEREFMHLFSNPKVQVVQTLEGKAGSVKISIEDYVIMLGDLFPSGLVIDLDTKKMSIEQPAYDRNNRYLVRIRANQSWKGITGGKVFSSNQRVIYQVAFYYNNGIPENFTFYGMDLLQKSQSCITAAFSPARTGFINSDLDSDARWGVKRETGYKGELSYSYYFSNHWGVGSGVQFSYYSGSVSLGHFDALGGFDPNIGDINIRNDLWFVEVPLLLSVRSYPSKRLEFIADFGLSLGFRTYERMSSSALNTSTGASMENVISDADWIDQMNRLNLGLQGSVSVNYWLNNRMGIRVGAGIRQGLSGLDSYTQTSSSSSDYLGQYNPLWGAPGKTVNQSIYINIGVSVRLNHEQN